MKDYAQATDNTSLKEPFSPCAHTGSDLFKKAETDSEPLRNAPVPLALHTSEILPRFMPDPLLAITPEKSLAQIRAEKTLRSHEERGGERRGRQRVRFAPDTRASPPSKASDLETERKMVVDCEESDRSNNASKSGLDELESLPRSFSAVSHKFYQPGRYTDYDDGRDSFPPSSSVSKSSASSVPKRRTVESQPNQTVKASVDQSVKNITSTYRFSNHHPEKPLTTRIVRHKPTNESSGTESSDSFNGYAAMETLPRTPPRSRSASPSHCSRSPQPSRKMSPNRQGRSPASSPARHRSSPSRGGSGRATPVGGVELEARIMEEESEPEILVIREAPYHPKHNDYVFPFEEGKESVASYDPTVENPLARPEFNSALKIGQELKSVKGKQPDTWGAVSQKLKSCERKRTEIQEKAASRVNFHLQSGLYSDLVDVDVPLDDLCHTLEKDMRLRAPSPKAASTVKVPVGKEPDLMEFFSPDLQQELLDLTLTGMQPITESLTTANPMLAFDLYRHNRTWNGLTDS